MSPSYSDAKVVQLLELYRKFKDQIISRVEQFHRIWREQNEDAMFKELIFCLLTPQSKAKYCWAAVEELFQNDFVFHANWRQIAEKLNYVRFKNTKARRIEQVAKSFAEKRSCVVFEILHNCNENKTARDKLVKQVNGLGYKEASHFLRNIGRGQELAILDRHILKNLAELGVIERIPKSLTRKRYLNIEGKMVQFAQKIGIPMEHLDLLLWAKQTGEVFK
ncbi:MAG TPA: N-glycosylase/DNA lyase [candidate division Zixibacteria bacterium]|nr:N-glycosylase/DNA lyase [candidate division Zixibacteria bacterium]